MTFQNFSKIKDMEDLNLKNIPIKTLDGLQVLDVKTIFDVQ
jgi:hypothetical protein